MSATTGGRQRLNGTAHGKANGKRSPPAVAVEEYVVGCLLAGGDWKHVADLRGEDFAVPELRLIFAAMSALALEGIAVLGPGCVTEQLQRTNHLKGAGGAEYVQQLLRETSTAANLPLYARRLRQKANARALREVADNDEELLKIAERITRDRERVQRAAGPQIEVRTLVELIADRTEVEWLGGLTDILERRVMALLVGPRNSFKSFIALHWAMLAALAGEAVLILSAEGNGLGRRIEAWLKHHASAVDPRSLNVLAIERAMSLNSVEGLARLRELIDARQMTPAVTFVDTVSKFSPGLDENDNGAVALFLAGVCTTFVEHYGSTVCGVVHTGHADPKRPRGASVLMANPDAEYVVTRPDPIGLSVTVSRERFKDSAVLPPLAYTAETIDLGRADRRGHPVTSFALRDIDASAVVASAKAKATDTQPHGKAQRQLLAALRAQSGDGSGIWTLADIREVARKAGQHKNTARAAAEALTFTPHLIATVGGWKLSP